MYITVNKNKEKLQGIKEKIQNVTKAEVLDIACHLSKEKLYEINIKVKIKDEELNFNITSFEDEALLGILLQEMYNTITEKQNS